MKIGFFTINLNFADSVLEELRAHHTVRVFQAVLPLSKNQILNAVNIFGLMQWCDVAYFEFTQYPLDWVSQQQWIDKPVVARDHGLEVAEHKRIDWRKVSALIIQPTQYKRLKRLRRVHNQKHPKQILPPLPKKILQRYVGVDLKSYTLDIKRKPGYNIVLHSTVLRETKGIYTALECFAELLRRDTSIPWHFTLIGQGEGGWDWGNRKEYVMEVEELLEDLHLPPKHFTHVNGNYSPEHWNSFLKTQDLYWCFSLRESFGVSLGEACARGVYPFINRFYGSDLLYPEDNLCRYPGEFIDKTMTWSALSDEEKLELRRKIRKHVEQYDQFETAKSIRYLIEELGPEG